MAVLPILISGEPVLHAPAARVEAFDDDLAALVHDLRETMRAAPGVGLAAPQVGVSARVFVFEWEAEDGRLHRGTAVNPELWLAPSAVGPLDEDGESEGCLSFPGERFPLRRSPAALLRARDESGASYEMTASGWLARILQHEYDHLDGLLYTDRLEPVPAKAAAKAGRRNGWGRPGHRWVPGVDDLEG